MKGVFTCPDDMSPHAVSLLQGLIEKDVSKRIGRLANGADDMRRHPWYTEAEFDWVSCSLSAAGACICGIQCRKWCPSPVAATHTLTHLRPLTVSQPSLQSLQMDPPFIPDVGGDEDTSCFVVEADSDEEDPEEWQNAFKEIESSDQHLFEGF
jgi:hypothetical protein